MESKLILVIILLGLALTTQSKKGKKGKGQNGIIRILSNCGGQSLNVSSQLEASKECLESRIQEIQDKVASANENANKKGKKKRKKKGIAKKLRKKCMADCQWDSFGLIPDANNGTEYDTSSLDFTTFLNLFPESAQESLQSEMLACYNTSTIEPLKEGKKMNMGMAKQMCSRNKKLLKCLERKVKSTCKSMKSFTTTPKPQVSSTTSTNAESSTSANLNSTSVAPANSTPISPSTDMTNDDTDGSNGEEEDDDDEEDDGNEDEDVQVTTSPSAFFNTSRPVTK